MADSIISNDPNTEKSNVSELIYLGALICDTISELEPHLNLFLSHDYKLRFLIAMKNRWIGRFWEIEKLINING